MPGFLLPLVFSIFAFSSAIHLYDTRLRPGHNNIYRPWSTNHVIQMSDQYGSIACDRQQCRIHIAESLITIGINCLHSFRVSSFEYNGPNSKIIALISWKRIQLQTHQVSKRYFSVLRSFIIYQICTITFHSAATELDSPLQCHPAPVGREAWAELLKYYKY